MCAFVETVVFVLFLLMILGPEYTSFYVAEDGAYVFELSGLPMQLSSFGLVARGFSDSMREMFTAPCLTHTYARAH